MNQMFGSLVDRGYLPPAVRDIASCIPMSDAAEALGIAVLLYSNFGLYKEVDSDDGVVTELITTPNKSGTIAVVGGGAATWSVEYEDEDGNQELYDNQPSAVDGDGWDIQLVYASKKIVITQTGGDPCKICITL